MNDLLDLHAGQWNLCILPGQGYEQLLILCARLAEHVPLIILDCNRRYDPSVVVQAARGRIEITDRIQSQRAFICYEVAKLLQRTPAGNTPVLVLDMLATFYDENVQMNLRRFLLENSILHLQRLGSRTAVAVFVQPPPVRSDSYCLFEHLRSAAPRVSTYANEETNPMQLELF
jgi:hypothetical protein